MCRLSVAQYFLTLLSFFRASLQCIRFISDDSLINRKEIWNLFKSKLFVYSFSRFHSFCMLEISCCGWGKEMGGVGEGKGGGEGVINSQAALLWVTAIRLSLQYT